MKNPKYPCLWFDGNAKEAAEYYCSVFPDSKITVDTQMLVHFELANSKFMGLNGGPQFKFNPSVSFFVKCKTVDQVNEIWDKMIVGGFAMMAIDTYPWSARYGWLQDKFGLSWQISVHDAEFDQMITPALLFTNEQLGNARKAIDLYSFIFENSKIDLLAPYPTGDTYEGNLMFSQSSFDDFTLNMMDGPGAHNFVFNEAVSFVCACENQAEIDYFWGKLTANGGKESMCGWLLDPFGISWQIIPKNLNVLLGAGEKGQRAMQALLKMKKIDIQILKNA